MAEAGLVLETATIRGGPWGIKQCVRKEAIPRLFQLNSFGRFTSSDQAITVSRFDAIHHVFQGLRDRTGCCWTVSQFRVMLGGRGQQAAE